MLLGRKLVYLVLRQLELIHRQLVNLRLGINTVARAAHADYAEAFVSAATDPRANLDVVGTAWILGKTIENFAAHATYAARTQTAQDHAFMVGGDSLCSTNMQQHLEFLLQIMVELVLIQLIEQINEQCIDC